MIWQVEIGVKGNLLDPVSEGVKSDIRDLGIKSVQDVRFVRIYVIDGSLSENEIDVVARSILADPVIHNYSVSRPLQIHSGSKKNKKFKVVSVFHKPGVMDPVEASTIQSIKDLGFQSAAVRTGRKFILYGQPSRQELKQISRKILANEVIDQIFFNDHRVDKIAEGSHYSFNLTRIPLLELGDEALVKLSRERLLALDLKEMQVIKEYYTGQRRNPTDIELETLAQTWSEHCKHKTLMGAIDYYEEISPLERKREQIDNLLRQTIMRVTTELDRPWCISVFKDNAGIIEFDKNHAVCFKVETHNHPSAIEPYGGAGTGIGGVIRDTLGCGLGAKPVLNTDVFCFGPPDLPARKLPQGVLHPKRILKGVVGGVRDYGNRMGIPTSNGAVYFDERYTGNPLVYCGNVGILPRTKCFKHPQSGELIVLVGGRTGRDGIHGVTFASLELTESSESVAGSSVQIGNAITEKKVLDTLLQARDQGLYSSITDCGGGGLSSAIGEMGEDLGALVHLEKVPLKYQGLSYSEIWISEAQERMVMSVPSKNIDAFMKIFADENVEANVIGEFTNDKKLTLKYQNYEVGQLDMEFLHQGLPKLFRKAEWRKPKYPEPKLKPPARNYGSTLKKILGMWNICSKEWIIRQYDHEVQGGSVLKPLQGISNDGPGDACVFRPVLGSKRGVVVSNGMSPKFGDIDPYHMAASGIDEALRNLVAVGGNLEQTALLDNFSWGNTNKPDRLGGLVRASKACYDIAKVYGTPFISGKDSLNNEYKFVKGEESETIVIPPSLLISAISVIPDVGNVISMDLKEADNLIYLVGLTKPELGGSHYYELLGAIGNKVPQVDPVMGKKSMLALSEAMFKGCVSSCHDLSEGGLAVAAAEMAFAGMLGLKLDLAKVTVSETLLRDDIVLFSESNSRFLVEVPPSMQNDFEEVMKDCPVGLIGQVQSGKRLKIKGLNGRTVVDENLVVLKEAWQKPLQS